ncbi:MULTISPECIES: DUF1127 domain-containing protein [unclassified Phyllobacterium]|uniref:DUF1127 domain-containing protein n=1 Tax=Phyllobacterium TaxID=28100 RepID=UPI000DD6EDD1|nr:MULTISPECIES: DUF1127 domain-containing protein [unclassified Phyllobacterium]MBA8902221.1 uncharacterized protein YjiS (DUF1127 family) [Phyllobacterium sp. P30BS-XVII]UGX86965.1 DUF1127 domain-containing protein [Phyllobacterium sp. T1293]
MGTTFVEPNQPAIRGLTYASQPDFLSQFAGWVESALMKRRTRLQLGRLSDEGLKDLALTRDHVEADLDRYLSA